MLNYIKQHKIATLVVLNLVAVAIVAAVIIIHLTKTAVIDILVTPKDATITLNGKRYDNQKQHDILPGNYHVKITMDNMQTKEFDITLEKNGFVRISDYLLDTNGSFDYYLTHSMDAAILTKVVKDDDELAKSFVAEYEKITNITDILPFNYDAYTDDYSEYTQYSIYQDIRDDCDKAVCLIIEDNTGGNEQIAKDKLKELGYDLNNYSITYEYVPLYTAEINSHE